MKTIDFSHVKSIQEFQAFGIKELEKTHGKGYCDMHRCLQRILTNKDSYMELGVYQGTAAATAILQNPRKINLLDIKTVAYEAYLGPLAREYCDKNSIDLVVIKSDSLKLAKIPNVDVLLIDSNHKFEHLLKELIMYSPFVRRHILIHDTSHKEELFKALKIFCFDNKIWSIEDRSERSVGFTLLKRI